MKKATLATNFHLNILSYEERIEVYRDGEKENVTQDDAIFQKERCNIEIREGCTRRTFKKTGTTDTTHQLCLYMSVLFSHISRVRCLAAVVEGTRYQGKCRTLTCKQLQACPKRIENTQEKRGRIYFSNCIPF